MKLTGIILFVGSLIGFILWIIRTGSQLLDQKTIVHKMMGGEVTINILPAIILFVIMAISAGIAWG